MWQRQNGWPVANVPISAEPLKRITQQPRVRDFLSAALVEGRLSHAYLFLGAPGSGMLEAADALAQCVVCPHGGDGTCEECVRVARHTHPDVKHYMPGGVAGYLVEQVREMLADVALAPVRATCKVYILDSADRLRGQAANALLKTIEEPPPGVMFILVARTADAMLPTIVSRCQQVPFRVVPTVVAQDAVMVKAGVGETEARIALSVAGTPQRAVELLSSPARRNVRRVAVRILGELANDDAWDVLKAAEELNEEVRRPFEEQRGKTKGRKKKASEDDASEFLSAKALKQIEDAQKRELTMRERSGMMEALAAIESLLRDVLIRCERAMDAIVNEDVEEVVDRIAAASTTAGVLEALKACRTAANNLAHNVSSQLTLEVLLLSIKEALA